MLNACKHRLGEIPLDSYQSWTRAAKAVTYAKAQEHYEQLQEPQAHMQLQMVIHLMGSILHQQPEAAICKCTFNLQHACPDWLRPWCLRWGFTSGFLTILRIEAFPETTPELEGHDFLGHSIHTRESWQAATLIVYVPCLC